MSVQIDEVVVEARVDRPQAVAADTPATPQQHRIDLASALERLRERRERLKAD
jgi:hypothetical protein